MQGTPYHGTPFYGAKIKCDKHSLSPPRSGAAQRDRNLIIAPTLGDDSKGGGVRDKNVPVARFYSPQGRAPISGTRTEAGNRFGATRARTPPLLSRFKEERFKRERGNRNPLSLLWFFGHFLSIQKVPRRRQINTESVPAEQAFYAFKICANRSLNASLFICFQ